MEIKLRVKKTTERSVVYQQVPEEAPAVGTFYLQKWVHLELNCPEVIRLSIVGTDTYDQDEERSMERPIDPRPLRPFQ